MARRKLEINAETEILTLSKRRCALCTGLFGDYSEKMGQIAHLDKDNSNNNIDNLCFLCLDHHSKYDSKTSQHKNYTKNEVKEYRSKLYFDLKNYDFNKIEPTKNSITKPYAIKFNGINGFLLYDEIDNVTNKEFIIDTEFRIHNQYYSGILFNIINSSRNEFLFVVHHSSKHPSKANQIELCFMKAMKITTIFSFVENISKWTNLILKVNSKNISLTINEREAIQSNQLMDFAFNKIEIGGTKWENEKFDINIPAPNYLTSYFRNFRLFNNQEIISNLEFSYGKKYFFETSLNEKMKLYGGFEFVKMNL